MRATGIKTRWVNSDRQLADVLTKPTAPSASIHRLQQTGRWKIVWDADFTSAKNIRKEKRDKRFKGKQVKGKTAHQDYVAFDPQTDQADLVNHIIDMERQSGSGGPPIYETGSNWPMYDGPPTYMLSPQAEAPYQPPPTYGLSPLAEVPVPEDPYYSSESEVDSDLDTDMAVVAAPYLSLDPFESGDQDDYMEVRASLNFDSRVEELFEQWVDAVEERFKDDKEKQARLIHAFQIEQEAFRLAMQDANLKVKEQKDKKKKKKPKNHDRELPPDFDMAKPYFMRASQQTDMCEEEKGPTLGSLLLEKTKNHIDVNGSFLQKPRI